MKEYRIGQVFEDAEHFDPPKRLKCVRSEHERITICNVCEYRILKSCRKIACLSSERDDCTPVHFIETTEPIG